MKTVELKVEADEAYKAEGDRWVEIYGKQIIGRMQAEGFPADPAAWSEADMAAGLLPCVRGHDLVIIARHMQRQLREVAS